MERRDPAFETKMVPVLHVYKEVQIVNEYLGDAAGRQLGMVTISYDEKPGIQALAVTTPDLPPVPGKHTSHLRDSEYKRLGTVSLPEKVGRCLSEPPKDPLSPGQPFCAHLEGDTQLLGHYAATIRVCVHTNSRIMAESDRESIQQDDANHATRNPRGQQSGVDRPHPSIL